MNDQITITRAELKDLLASKEPFTLLDVREVSEHILSSIPGDVLIPLGELSKRAPTELDPTKPLVIYCAHGVRSLGAAHALKSLGFKNVRSLIGGISQYFEN